MHFKYKIMAALQASYRNAKLVGCASLPVGGKYYRKDDTHQTKPESIAKLPNIYQSNKTGL